MIVVSAKLVASSSLVGFPVLHEKAIVDAHANPTVSSKAYKSAR